MSTSNHPEQDESSAQESGVAISPESIRPHGRTSALLTLMGLVALLTVAAVVVHHQGWAEAGQVIDGLDMMVLGIFLAPSLPIWRLPIVEKGLVQKPSDETVWRDGF